MRAIRLEDEQNVIDICCSLALNLKGLDSQRFLRKFMEKNYQKSDRAVELHESI